MLHRSVTLLILLLLARPAAAFDGERPGLVLGAGAGPATSFVNQDLDGFRLALENAGEHLAAIPQDGWDADARDASLRTLAERLELGLGKIMQPIRIAITGGTVSEAVNELLVVVGKDQSLQRMRDALGWEPK